MNFIYFSFLELLFFFFPDNKIINIKAYYELKILIIIDSGFFMELRQLKYFKDAAELENFP